jgi:hypothetical protein
MLEEMSDYKNILIYHLTGEGAGVQLILIAAQIKREDWYAKQMDYWMENTALRDHLGLMDWSKIVRVDEIDDVIIT